MSLNKKSQKSTEQSLMDKEENYINDETESESMSYSFISIPESVKRWLINYDKQ